MNHRKPNHKTGFSLVELLVVLAIIAILAGLLIPGVARAMQIANQMRDVNNVKNIALILIADSMENGGNFRTGKTREDFELDSTTQEVFQGLIDDGLIDDPSVFAGKGSTRATSFTLSTENIGFQYIAGHTDISPSKLPMLVTKGTGVTHSSLTAQSLPATASPWGKKGLVVAYVAGNANWIRGSSSEEGPMSLNEPLGMAKNIPEVKVYE
ncbi:MAG: type II secretion system protein [Verrucomicrobiota bacterium]